MPINSSIFFLPVTIISETYHFYHDILCLPLYQKHGDSLCIFDTGYGYWGFCQYGDGRALLSGPKGVCLSLNLDDNDEVLSCYEKLKDRVRIFKQPQQHERFPVYSFFVCDPDDYLVEFQKIA